MVIEMVEYLVRVQGSNRVTVRNRKFLRKMTPFQVSSPATRSMPSEWATPVKQQVPRSCHAISHAGEMPVVRHCMGRGVVLVM